MILTIAFAQESWLDSSSTSRHGHYNTNPARHLSNRMISTTSECMSCLSAGGTVCQAANDITNGFCCEKDHIDTKYCSVTPGNVYAQLYQRCSKEIPTPSAKALACPQSYRACHNSEHAHVLDEKSKPELALSLSNRYFFDGEACFFEVSTDIDPENEKLYFIDIDFQTLLGVQVQLHNGTSLSNTGSVTLVSMNGLRLRYSADNGNKVWLIFTAIPGYLRRPTFLAKFKLVSEVVVPDEE